MSSYSITIIVVLLLAVLQTSKSQNAPPNTFTIKSGTIRGKSVQPIAGRQVQAFLGIPFGKPPIGERRFKAPEMFESFETKVFDATKYGASCYYTMDTMFKGFAGAEMWNPKTGQSEDCLNLNVWVPVDNPEFDGTVFVWIYGGGFFSGSPSLDLYNGDVLAAQAGAIVVNINYRLGPFGFLFLNSSEAPGNMGLLDQQLALQWIYENIDTFGGDKRKVTLMGESAGAASVAAHLFSPKSWPFFHNIILQSGSVSNNWAVVSQDKMLHRTNRMAEIMNCPSPTEDSDAAMVCMRQRSKEQVQAAADELLNEVRFMEFPFAPVNADGAFFARDVHRMLREGAFSKVPILAGSMKDEGSYWLPYYQPDFKFHPNLGKDATPNQALISWEQYLQAVNITFANHLQPISIKAVGLQYIMGHGGHSTTYQLRDAISNMVDDYFFTCDLINFLRKVIVHDHRVFVYYFTQRSRNNAWPEWMGAMHGYEIEYIYGEPIRRPQDFPREEVVFSKRMIDVYATFARTGKPSAKSPLKWDTYRSPSFEHYELNAKQETLITDLRADRCALLNESNKLKKLSSSADCGVTSGTGLTSPSMGVCAVSIWTLIRLSVT